MGCDTRNAAWRVVLSLAVAAGLTGHGISAQTTTSTQPQFKGIWEPVSFTEDLDLNDVFFVTADVGWAVGKSGTIIHTKNGGAKWTAQLGGDPASTDAEIKKLRFLDEYRGWAVQERKLLHTTHGQDWEEVPGRLPERLGDYTFVSPTRGVAAASSTIYQATPTEVFLTEDGGRSWRKVAQCQLRVMIDGVNRNVSCGISRIHFPTPDVGYLVGYSPCAGMGCGGPPVLGKTVDGGATWEFKLGPGDVASAQPEDAFFTDERHGIVKVGTYQHGKIFSTSDGGETWKGVVGSPGQWLRFADPEVGWAFEREQLSYTTDGGARWNSRPHRFPVEPEAISFPRRDRAYVVGEHGMVFRYSVVPAAKATPAGVMTTAAMPTFSSPLDGQVAQLEQVVDSLQAMVQLLPDTAKPTDQAAGAAGGAASDVAMTADTPLDTPQPAASAFTAKCCGKGFARIETMLGAIAVTLPQLMGNYKNTNLLLAAVRMLADLPGQFRSVKGGLAAFRTATDRGTAIAALAQVTAAIDTLKAQARAALQKELPPPAATGDAPEAESSSAQAVKETSAAVVESVTGNAVAKEKSKTADGNKKKLGGLLKRRLLSR